ncbi:Cap-specific mRNA (nucleoside-2'-O-)-methyltransferase 1 [Sparganum proliferum]
MRRCRELRPTVALPTNISSDAAPNFEDELSGLLRGSLRARMLVIRAAEDAASQYLPLMNSVFTVQKLCVPIDACIIPPTTVSSTPEDLRHTSVLHDFSYSSLLEQAADLTGDIYLRVPRPAGLLQYLISDNEPVDNMGWKLMRNMGYESGKGLWADSQGRTEAVPIEMKKDRRGLGMNKSSSARDLATPKFDFHHGPNAWHKDMEAPEVDDDHLWIWSRWGDPSPIVNGDVEDALQATPKERSIQHLLLNPTSSEALGEPVSEMRTQTLYCSKVLLHELFDYKDELDSISRDRVTDARMRSNPFENIRRGIFMNRAAMKMANMDHLLGYLFSRATRQNEVLHFADVCAGPGGFSEYLLWRRCNPPVPDKTRTHPETNEAGEATKGDGEQEVKLARADIKVRGYGMTLIGDCDFKLNDLVAGPVEAFWAHYGTDKNGDITSWANLNSFANFVRKCTDGKGVSVVMADGAFDVSGQQNRQEVLSKRIYLCQCLCALTVLRPGGHFITNMFDGFTEFSADLVRLMSHVFREIAFIKPVTSRPANSERYFLCKGLLSTASFMAGCPAAPPSVEHTPASRQESIPSSIAFPTKPKYGLPGHGRRLKASLPAKPTSSQYEQTVGPVDTESAVGVLIQHLLDVNEKLRRLENEERGEKRCTVLRLCHPEVVEEDRLFTDFLRKSNEEMAKKQCTYLSKLLAYAEDATLSDGRQENIREACLRKWKIPAVLRSPVPWPLWPHNHIKILSEIGVDSKKGKALDWLPPSLSRPEDVPLFTSLDLNRREFAPDSLVAVVCGSAHNDTDNGLARPMTIYSGGGMPNGMNIEFTYDGKIWQRLSSKFPNLKPRIPAASLLWGIVTFDYNQKVGFNSPVPSFLLLLDFAPYKLGSEPPSPSLVVVVRDEPGVWWYAQAPTHATPATCTLSRLQSY